MGTKFGEVYNFSYLKAEHRPTMIMSGCSNIRELLGHKCSIDWIETQPAVRLEKTIGEAI